MRTERFAPHAFRSSVQDPSTELHLLYAHDFTKPLASKGAGTLKLEDTPAGLIFEAQLPTEALQPTWTRDTVLAIRHGDVRSVSPGFRVLPVSVVPDAEYLEPDRANPGFQTRVITQATLYEISTL